MWNRWKLNFSELLIFHHSNSWFYWNLLCSSVKRMLGESVRATSKSGSLLEAYRKMTYYNALNNYGRGKISGIWGSVFWKFMRLYLITLDMLYFVQQSRLAPLIGKGIRSWGSVGIFFYHFVSIWNTYLYFRINIR